MKAVGVIPARYGSTRFPGKPLAKILGKPLLQWVIEAAKSSQRLSEVIVATDHGEIFDFVEGLGAKVVMTASDLPSGSDRVYAATLTSDADIIVNIQGDEPLLEGQLLDRLIQPLQEDPKLEISTLASPLESDEIFNKNVVKVLVDQSHNAIYFSRYPIPYSRLDATPPYRACFKHMGLYAYQREFLKTFCMQKPVELELAESLEQLRALYLGAKIRVVSVDSHLHGVDTPEDIQKVEKILQKKGSHGS